MCSASELLPTLCLEAGVKSHQEGVGGGLLEDVLLRLHPVDILQGRGYHEDHVCVCVCDNGRNNQTFLHHQSEDVENQDGSETFEVIVQCSIKT